jgi:hypothetical protein
MATPDHTSDLHPADHGLQVVSHCWVHNAEGVVSPCLAGSHDLI